MAYIAWFEGCFRVPESPAEDDFHQPSTIPQDIQRFARMAQNTKLENGIPIQQDADHRLQVVFRSTKLSGAICPRSPTRLPHCTACASSRPMQSSLSPDTGISCAVCTRSRRPLAKSLLSTWYVWLIGMCGRNAHKFLDLREAAPQGQEFRYLDPV